MRIKPGIRDLLWMAVGAAILLVFTLVALRFHDERDVGAEFALKARKVDLVGRMRTGLASAAEAEKSAVLATTDEDSRAFADRARELSAGIEQVRQELSALLQADGAHDERNLLAQFSEAFVELQRIDADVLSLAVKNTNLKAYALAYGPAAEALSAGATGYVLKSQPTSELLEAIRTVEALSDMGGALARLGAEDPKAALLASAAQIAALRVQILLPPHIAAESDEKMDELEARMAKDEHEVRANLDALATLPSLAGNPDLATATSQWTRFGEIKTQILALSRENTNVRSLDISLHRKRTVLLVNQDALAALQQAVEEEHVGGTSAGRWALPR